MDRWIELRVNMSDARRFARKQPGTSSSSHNLHVRVPAACNCSQLQRPHRARAGSRNWCMERLDTIVRPAERPGKSYSLYVHAWVQRWMRVHWPASPYPQGELQLLSRDPPPMAANNIRTYSRALSLLHMKDSLLSPHGQRRL
jgi:hypothetical protein